MNNMNTHYISTIHSSSPMIMNAKHSNTPTVLNQSIDVLQCIEFHDTP